MKRSATVAVRCLGRLGRGKKHPGRVAVFLRRSLDLWKPAPRQHAIELGLQPAAHCRRLRRATHLSSLAKGRRQFFVQPTGPCPRASSAWSCETAPTGRAIGPAAACPRTVLEKNLHSKVGQYPRRNQGCCVAVAQGRLAFGEGCRQHRLASAPGGRILTTC